MLIDKGMTEGEIVSIKLTSGEEVIAKFISETADGFKVSKPLVLSMNQQGIGMMPFMFTLSQDKDVLIYKHSISVINNCDKMFADQYIQGTTGIKLS